MVGKTPSHIIAVRPLKNGVISDFEITEKCLNNFFEKTNDSQKFLFLNRPTSSSWGSFGSN